jgi:hypothetical protein
MLQLCVLASRVNMSVCRSMGMAHTRSLASAPAWMLEQHTLKASGLEG